MSTEDHTVSFSLEINVEKAYVEVRKLQTILYRTLSLAHRLGLPEDIRKGIRDVQQLIIILNRLRLAYRAVQLARMAAGDPIAWGLAGVTVAETVVTIGELQAAG